MSSKREVKPNPEKDPSEWTTGDEPMTGPQASYLKTLCQEAKVEFDENLTKAQASQKIEELQKMTGRGAAAQDQQSDEAFKGVS
jgi:DUF3072 family protein